MGKSLIIKGADFSKVAVDVISTVVWYNTLTDAIKNCTAIGFRNTKGYAALNPNVYTELLNKDINVIRIFLNKNAVTTENKKFADIIGETFQVLFITNGAAFSAATEIATFTITENDINKEYKDIIIPKTTIVSGKSIAIGDKTGNIRTMLPLLTLQTGSEAVLYHYRCVYNDTTVIAKGNTWVSIQYGYDESLEE